MIKVNFAQISRAASQTCAANRSRQTSIAQSSNGSSAQANGPTEPLRTTAAAGLSMRGAQR